MKPNTNTEAAETVQTTSDQAVAPAAICSASSLARRFHDAYERLAPQYGYETRIDTKVFAPDTPNGRLMTAVCAEVMAGFTEQLRAIAEMKEYDQDDAQIASLAAALLDSGNVTVVGDGCSTRSRDLWILTNIIGRHLEPKKPGERRREPPRRANQRNRMMSNTAKETQTDGARLAPQPCSALVCYTCKTRFDARFDAPQDTEAHEDIICPGCGERHMRIFYHKVYEANAKDRHCAEQS